MPYGHQVSGKSPWPMCNAFTRSKVMEGSTRGQIVHECPWEWNLVGRSLDRNIVHWWGQRSWRGQQRRCQPGVELPMTTNSGRKNPWQGRNILRGSKVMHGSARGLARVKLLGNALGPPNLAGGRHLGQSSCTGNKTSTIGQLSVYVLFEVAWYPIV